jgi:hypothetical protein
MLPSSPPPIRAHVEQREAIERDAIRPLRRPAMASPVLMAGRIAVALLEVEAGSRPAASWSATAIRRCGSALPRAYAAAVARRSPAEASGAFSSRSTSLAW